MRHDYVLGAGKTTLLGVCQCVLLNIVLQSSIVKSLQQATLLSLELLNLHGHLSSTLSSDGAGLVAVQEAELGKAALDRLEALEGPPHDAHLAAHFFDCCGADAKFVRCIVQGHGKVLAQEGCSELDAHRRPFIDTVRAAAQRLLATIAEFSAAGTSPNL